MRCSHALYLLMKACTVEMGTEGKKGRSSPDRKSGDGVDGRLQMVEERPEGANQSWGTWYAETCRDDRSIIRYGKTLGIIMAESGTAGRSERAEASSGVHSIVAGG